MRSTRNLISLLTLLGLLCTKPFLLIGAPVADFSANKYSGCSPLLVTFTNLSTGNNPTYYWEFGNGNTSTLQHPAASFINPGTYTVKLTVTDNTGSHIATKSITVFANPTADFTTATKGGCVSDSICFQDLTVKGSGNLSSWSWDFGDGKSSTIKNPCTTYSFGDTFGISLVVIDVNGCQSTATKNNYIVITPAHTVNFTQSTTVACRPPKLVNFTDNSSPAGNYTYLWDFGNGHTSSQKNPSENYMTRGVFNVKLTVTNTNGCKKSLTKNKLVVVHDPLANFTSSTVVDCSPMVAQMLNQSVAADTNLFTWQWRTSNGMLSSLKNPKFTFNTPGTYDITLLATIPGVCVDSITKTNFFKVSSKPQLGFNIDTPYYCYAPATIHIQGNMTNVSDFTWYFSDGTTSKVTNPVKTFSQFGSYDVKLVGKSVDGCLDSISAKGIIILRRNGFLITPTMLSGCAPITSKFTIVDTGLFKLKTWRWYINGTKLSDTSNQIERTFYDTGAYQIMVIGSTLYGCTDTSYAYVLVGSDTEHPSISVGDTTECYGGTTQFILDSIPSNPKAQWWIDYGDGTPTGKNPYHKYNSIGDYTVTVYSKHYGCLSATELSSKMHILGPKVDFDMVATFCPNDPVYFNNLSQGNNNTYFWKFGDGDSSQQVNPTHYYKDSGWFNITLFAIDSASMCVDSLKDRIYRWKSPQVGFKLENNIGCAPLTVRFTDTSIYTPGTIRSWNWDFTGPVRFLGKDTTFQVNRMGYSYVRLILYDTNGCKYFVLKDSAIHVYSGSAGMNMTPTTGCVPLKTNAVNASVTENKIVSYKWVWGDGDSVINDSGKASHLYTTFPDNQSVGYMVNYTITDTMGCKFVSNRIIKPTWPIVDFGNTLLKRCGVDSFTFSATQGVSYGLGPFKYKWDFGNNDTLIGQNVKHAYKYVDTLVLVKLIKKDVNGCVDSLTKNVYTDSRPPKSGFTATPLVINCPGPPVYFTDTSMAGSAPIKKWEWSFGDGSKSLLPNPAKTYLFPGKYNLSLKVTDSLNCSDSIYRAGYILIAGPTATYAYSPKNGCVSLGVNFTALSGNTKKFEWDLGDGWIDTNIVFKHVYDRPNIRGGSYKPNLTITDSAGCKRGLTDLDSIVVYPLPAPNFKTDRQILCLHSAVGFTNTTVHDIPMKVFHWEFGDGDERTDSFPFSNSFMHPYDESGIYSIMLVATDSLNCRDTIIKRNLIEVTEDTIPPAIPHVLRATVLNNESVLLDFNANSENDFSHYTVEYDFVSGVPTQFKDIALLSDTNYIQHSIDPLHEVYAYRVSATDVCNNISLPSVTHQTVELKAAGVTNAILLKWNQYLGWDSVSTYQIFKLNDTTSAYDFIAQVNSDTRDYIDTNVTCFKTYYYQIKAIQNSLQPQYSMSDTSGAVPFYVPLVPGTHNIRATVLNNQRVLVQWRKKTYRLPFTVLLYRSTDDNASYFLKELKQSDTSFIDEDVLVGEHTYTYTTYLKDNCGGVSQPSNIARTILLKGELKSNDMANYDPLLTWSPYNKWFNGVDHYDLQFLYDTAGKYQTIGSVNGAAPLEFMHQYVSNEQRDYCYKVIAYKKDSQEVFSESNLVCLPTAPRLYAPNVFTINGDNLNERFKLGGIFIDTYHIEIYNRYGQRVYESNDLHDSWDGTFNGQPCQSDVYVYLAEGTGRSGQQITLKGNVTLLR